MSLKILASEVNKVICQNVCKGADYWRLKNIQQATFSRGFSSSKTPRDPSDDANKIPSDVGTEDASMQGDKFSPPAGHAAGTTATRLDQNPDCGGRSRGHVSEELTQVSPGGELRP
jgi:hypothetical protein